MRCWWVNHRWTLREETEGGYLWSPKRNQNGARNQSYDNMALVEPGDLIFSYANQVISQVGVATGPAVTNPKPADFQTKGDYWNFEGWLLRVDWAPLESPLRPKSIISQLAPLLPTKYSPISNEGNGRQNIYLARISNAAANLILSRISERQRLTNQASTIAVENSGTDPDGDRLEAKIRNDTDIDVTEKEELIKARRGQGRFRRNLESIEAGCRMTGATDRRLLRASHIKPWRLCETNHERLDGNNGLLLTPTFDLLFDKGYISFSDSGTCLISADLSHSELDLIGLDASNQRPAGPFNAAQQEYLRFHRKLFGYR